ncbi:MAG: 3-oxoacyl-[acyl-carrier-protein] synthase [Chthoniobacter sp.]|jgi:3-oxoacyl-[acyl-carrier-protein] synthase II|nr:3-oxoacyl-[acyl-carrier-protein] synthase [Chthoniobacter sp.]
MPHTKRRVVITGMGVISASGLDLPTLWENVRLGRSAGALLTRFDLSDMPTRVAAQVENFDAAPFIGVKRAKRLDLSTRYGITAAILASRDAGLDVEVFNRQRAGVVEGITLGGVETTIAGQINLMSKNYRAINAFSLINGYSGAGSGEIALELGIRGTAVTYCSGSASGNDSMGLAWKTIVQDEADIMIAGGSEAPLLPALWAVFNLTGVMTKRNETPKTAMRPFDESRDGFLCGEGAAFVVMEDLSHALSRDAKIYAEVLAHGRAVEAYHSVAPHPEGIGMVEAMQKALTAARLSPEEIQYINVHGTATEANDLAETIAIKTVFGAHAARVAVSSTKPVTGHLLGAAGALETVICTLALMHHEIPPTINLHKPEKGCDLDYVPHRSRPYPLAGVMNLSSGFGGKNSCLILKRYPA